MRQVSVETIHYRKPFKILVLPKQILFSKKSVASRLKNNSGNLVVLDNPSFFHLQQFTTLLWN